MNQKGQTLIEVLAGLSAATVVIAAITIATISSLYNAQFSRDQSQATQYAQEGMETMRNLRDYSIASISANALPDANTYCMAQGCTSISDNTEDTQCGPAILTTCPQNINKFIRSVKVNHADPNCNNSNAQAVGVVVTVSWNDSKCKDTSNLFCHNVSVSSCLSNFTVVPAP